MTASLFYSVYFTPECHLLPRGAILFLKCIHFHQDGNLSGLTDFFILLALRSQAGNCKDALSDVEITEYSSYI